MAMRLMPVFLGFIVVGSAASADPPIGSRLGERLEKQQVRNEHDAAEAAHKLAGCILVKRGSAGRDLLSARSDEEVKRLRGMIGGAYECLVDLPGNDTVEAVSVSYPPDIMRGDIAEELLKRDRAAVAQLQPLPIQKSYARSWFAFTGRDTSVDEMADCVAETDPTGIMLLVDSDPTSGAETAAFSGLLPYMGPCLRAGTKPEGKREPLRAALAEALYQRLKNPGESLAGTRSKAPQAQAK